MLKKLFLAALFASIAACASVGTSFQDDNLAQLQPGVTTLQDAERILGAPPSQTLIGAGGKSVSIWRYVASNGMTGNTTIKEASLVFSPDGKFTYIYQLNNVSLAPQERKRLMTPPQAKN